MLIDQGIILTGELPWKVDPNYFSEGLTGKAVPTSLVGVLQARLDSLQPDEKTVLQQASVVGRSFWDESLRYLAGKSGNAAAVGPVLEALANRGMIFPRRTSSLSGVQEFSFKHALLRDVVYDSVVRRTRQKYHNLAAEWLIGLGETGAVELYATIAEHLELAGKPAPAAVYLRQAGEQAARRYANDQALHYLERALQLAPESEVLERFCSLVARTQVFSLLGARQKQGRDLAELVQLSEQLGDACRKAEANLLQAGFASEKSDYPAVIAHARKTIRLARAGDEPGFEARAHLLWGRALFSQGDYPAARASFEQALSIARSAGLKSEEADSLRKLGTSALRLGETSRALDYYESALAIYRQIGDRRGEGRALNGLGNALLVEGDLERGQRCFAEFLEISREIGDRLGEGQVVQEMGDAHLEQADYQGAVEYFEQALKIGREIGNRTIESSALVGMGNVHLQRSEYTRAKGSFDESLKIARQIGNRPWEAKTLAELGRLSMRQGDYSQAREHLTRTLELYRQLGDRLGESRALVDQGALFELLVDATSARQSAEAALAIARELRHPRYTGMALTLFGSAQAVLGEQEQSERAFREAISQFEDNALANQAIEAHARLAELYLAQGDLTRAGEQVQEVLRWLEPSGSASPPSDPSLAPSLEHAADPLRVYLAAFRVLKALGDGRAPGLLEQARLLLSRKAAGLSDKFSTDALIYNIPSHRDILRESRKSDLL
jgi:tetratricopeptide (TPR) repeat protein